MLIQPPDHIPTSPPNGALRPAPAMPESSWTDKPLLRSRTIVSIILTVALFVASKFFGIDVDPEAIGVSPDGGLTIGELLLLAGALLAGFFRARATGPIRGILYPPDNPPAP